MPKAHGAAVSPENLHALLLSTDRKTVDNVRTALVALGYRVRASRDIATGIRRFRLTSPDLLIIDAQLLERRVPETWSDDSTSGVGTVTTITPRRLSSGRNSHRSQRSLRHRQTNFRSDESYGSHW